MPELAQAAFEDLLDELAAAGSIEKSGPWLHAPGHRAELTGDEQTLWSRVEPLLRVEPFHPPRVRDVAHSLTIDGARAPPLPARCPHRRGVSRRARSLFHAPRGCRARRDRSPARVRAGHGDGGRVPGPHRHRPQLAIRSWSSSIASGSPAASTTVIDSASRACSPRPARRRDLRRRPAQLEKGRKKVGVEPTKNRMPILTGFEARPPHRGTLLFRAKPH